MRRADGLEEVLEFRLPVPFGVVPPLLSAIGECLEAEGWTEVSLTTDGRHTILGRPPGRRAEEGG